MSEFSSLQQKTLATRDTSEINKNVANTPSNGTFHAALPSMLEMVVSSDKGRAVHAKTTFLPGTTLPSRIASAIYNFKRSEHCVFTPFHMHPVCIVRRSILCCVLRGLRTPCSSQKVLKMPDDLVLQRCSLCLALVVFCSNFDQGMPTCGLVSSQTRVSVSPAGFFSFFGSFESFHSARCREMFGTDPVSEAEE